MFEINVNINAPEIVKALYALIAARPENQPQRPVVPAPKPVPPSPAPGVPARPPAPAQNPPQTYCAPVPAAPAPVPNAPAQAPTPSPAPSVPTTAPQYTYDMIFNAAAALMAQGKGPQLQQLLMKYSIQRLPDLTPDKFGAYAADLRGLGAQI